MLITALAFASQTLTLDADTSKAALTCAYSVAQTIRPGESKLQAGAETSYFLLTAAASMPGDASIFAKMTHLMSENASRAPLPAAEARQYMPQCEARFPRARSERAVTLPADPFERDVICYYSFALMAGVAHGVGDPDAYTGYDKRMRVFQRRVTDGRAARGLATEEALLAWSGPLVVRMLDQGNGWAYSAACESLAD